MIGAGALTELGRLAVQFGLAELADYADKAIAGSTGTSYTALSNNLNKILANAKNKLGPKYEELINKLGSIPGLSGSSAYDKVIRNAKKELNTDIQRVSKLNSQASNIVNTLEQQMTQFSYLPSTYKNSKQGRQELAKIYEQGNKLDKLVEQTMKRS